MELQVDDESVNVHDIDFPILHRLSHGQQLTPVKIVFVTENNSYQGGKIPNPPRFDIDTSTAAITSPHNNVVIPDVSVSFVNSDGSSSGNMTACNPTDDKASPQDGLIPHTSTSTVHKNTDSCSNLHLPLSTSTSRKPRNILRRPVQPAKGALTDSPRIIKWQPYPPGRNKVKLLNFTYTGPSGANPSTVPANIKTPFQYYSLFFCDNILQYLVNYTNLYAERKIISRISNESLSSTSRLARWQDVTLSELKVFFGILLWTGQEAIFC